jgi:hypothetical protein
VAAGVAHGFGEHGLGERLEPRRQVDVLALDQPQREVVMAAAQAFDLLAQGPGHLTRRRSQRAAQGVAELRERGLDLHMAARARLLVQRVLGREDEGHAEQALHHPVVDLPG